ncbi:hypothetical protein QR98_0094480, partial [Sarcoptes scabiei]
MCRLKTFILEGTANASVLTLDMINQSYLYFYLPNDSIRHLDLYCAYIKKTVAFTVERFLAICGSSKSMPPSTQTFFNTKSISAMKKIACRNIVLIWIFSLLGALPLVLLTRINYLDYDELRLEQSAWCGLAYNEPDKRWELVMLSSTIVFFLIPLTIITCLYYKIAVKLKQATKLDAITNQSDFQLTDHVTSRKIIQSRKIVIRML